MESHLIDNLQRRWKSVGLLWLLSWGHALAQAKDWENIVRSGDELRRSGRYVEAEQNYRAAVQAAEKFGDQDPRLARSLNNLAVIHKELGRYAEAVPLAQRALALWEAALGPNHPDVAAGLNNLANLYMRRICLLKPNRSSSGP